MKITVKRGWSYSIGTWLEWGTDPHFIRVAEDQRQGRSDGKINRERKTNPLVINGQFVAGTVFPPGARAEPFLHRELGHELHLRRVPRPHFVLDETIDGGSEPGRLPAQVIRQAPPADLFRHPALQVRLCGGPQIKIRIEVAAKPLDIQQGLLQHDQLRLDLHVEAPRGLKQPQQNMTEFNFL